MKYEIRDGRLHLTGYVNAVERDSKEIMTKRGRCVEQIRSGAFAKSLERNPEVRMKLNHKRTVSADMTLREDTIGLHVEADTDDEEIMALAAKGELRGWSFGFEALDDEIEQRDGRTPRRIVKDLDLSEVSVLSVTPAYNGTSLEYRSEDMCGDDSAEDVPAEDTAAEDTQADDMPVDDVSEESPVTLTDEQRAEIEQAKAYVEHLRRIGELERIRTEQRELEERYNHYHDPRTGRFASGKDGGEGLYYSMGKKKGEIVGAKSKWEAPKPAMTYEEYAKKLADIQKEAKKIYNDRKKATKNIKDPDERMKVWDEYTKKLEENGEKEIELKKSVPSEYIGKKVMIDSIGGTGKEAAILMPDGTYKTAGNTSTYEKAQKNMTKQVEEFMGLKHK